MSPADEPAARRPARVRREISAGGVVFRTDGEKTLILLIRDAHRNWGFPKGHVERGEDPASAAVREVREETGLETVDIIAPVRTISWRFRFRGALIHKTCHFFVISTRQVRTKPQRGEGITACRWVTLDHGERLITHDNARGVLVAAREVIGRATAQAIA